MRERLTSALEGMDARGEAIAEMVSRLVRFESVRPEEPCEDPIGPGIRDCLEFALELCRQRGMTTRSHEGQVGVAELGEGEESVAFAIHLDVVPAGDGWTHPPFSGLIADGWVWGRGAEDDKGPLASVLGALDALCDAGIALRRRVTLVLGTDEETGIWRDLDAFHGSEPMPTMTIVPDGSYPVVSAEKGFVNVALRFPPRGGGPLGRRRGAADPRIREIRAGDRPNIVPAEAEALIEGLDLEHLAARARAWEMSHPGGRLEIAEEGDAGRRVRAFGTPAHGSTPEKGRSALLDLAGFLAPEAWAPSAAESLVRFLDLAIGADVFGERVALFAYDPFMGYCTVNAGAATTSPEGSCELRVNVRTIAGQSAAEVVGAFDAMAQGLGRELGTRIEVRMEDAARPPLRVDEQGELVLALRAAFERVMGRPADCVSIGGTTFAKGFDNAVAFGPKLPEEEERAHQRDERVSIEALVRNARIYAVALAELAGAPEP